MTLKRLTMCADVINRNYQGYSLLDIGCRTMDLKPLLQGCEQYYGTDIIPGENIFECNLENALPFEDNVFYIVTALARALIHDPPVLVLDEAISALDSASEEKVMEAIHELDVGKAVVIIAHRLSTVRRADLIRVLNDGEVVESGTWDALLARDGMFKDLWRRQAV